MGAIELRVAHKKVSILKSTVPKIIKQYRPTNAEQGMHIAFNLVHKELDECVQEFWHSVEDSLPKKDGLYLVAIKSEDGRLRTRTSWYVDGAWSILNNTVYSSRVVYWATLPQLPKESE